MRAEEPRVLKLFSLIYATAGSGKSYFLKEGAPQIVKRELGMSLGKAEKLLNRKLIIDGDTLIEESIGWPEGEWWLTMSGEELDDFVDNVTHVVASAAIHSFVVFGVFPRGEEGWQKLLDNTCSPINNRVKLPIVVLKSDKPTLSRNMAMRLETDPDTSKPTDPVASFKSQAAHLKDAQSVDIPIVRWDELPKLFTNYVRQFRYLTLAAFASEDTRYQDGTLFLQGRSIVDSSHMGVQVRTFLDGFKTSLIVEPIIDELSLEGDRHHEVFPFQAMWLALAKEHSTIRYRYLRN